MDKTRRVRIMIFSIVMILVAFGVVMIYSASAIHADQRYGDSMYFLKRHFVSLGIGFIGAVVAMSMDYRDLRRWVKWILAAVFLGLLVVLIPGLAHRGGGASRWFPLFGFHVQPSEFAKIALVLYLSDAIARAENIHDFKKSTGPMLGVAFGMIGFIILQPDLGSSAVLGAMLLLLLFVAGIKLRYFAWLIASGAGAFVLAVMIEPYRMRRIVSFMRPWEDMQGAGFQLWQSFLALGSGGLAGVGLGQSQQKLFYLPAAHTDFIFSIIGEELGFVGAGFVIILFTVFVIYGFRVSARCPNLFGRLASLGLVAMIGLEAIINIGVSIGAFPTKGLALPFISYGGSSMIAKLICVGLILNISRDAEADVARK